MPVLSLCRSICTSTRATRRSLRSGSITTPSRLRDAASPGCSISVMMGGTNQAAAAAVGLCGPTLGMTASAHADHTPETCRLAGLSAGDALSTPTNSPCSAKLPFAFAHDRKPVPLRSLSTDASLSHLDGAEAAHPTCTCTTCLMPLALTQARFGGRLPRQLGHSAMDGGSHLGRPPA